MECSETLAEPRKRKRARSSSSSSGEDEDRSLPAVQALLRKQRYPTFEDAFSAPDDDEGSPHYTACAVLGEGRFGTVFAALDESTNTPCAIKWVPRRHTGCNSLMREAEALHLVRYHPGFVHIQRYLLCGRELLFVLERCECDLVQHLRAQPKQRGLPYAELEGFLDDMLGALAFLHDTLEFVHRDLKPGNLLVVAAAAAGRRALKLSDFGTACPVSELAGDGGHVCGTYTFCAPEFLLGMPDYGTAVDLWSAGVTLSMMLHDGSCFSQSRSNTQFETLICVFRVFGTPTEASWPGVTTALPHFFPEFPRLAPAPQKLDLLFAPPRYRNAALLSVLRGLLQPCPAHRLTAHKALSLLHRRK